MGDDTSASATPTFAREIAPIFYEKCATCHRPGQIGPMPLLTHDDARPWAKAIRKVVVNREMPPWHADPAIGHWSNDMSLAPAQIASIARWVDAGAPAGDLTKVPPPPNFTDSWQFGKPDVEFDLPETKVPSGGPDILLDHVVKVEIPEGGWLSGVEFLPGDRRVVHHITGYVGNASMNGPAGESAAFSPAVSVFVIWAGGAAPLAYPQGVGHKLNRVQTFTFNMHYHPFAGVEVTDRTRVGLHLGKGEIQKVCKNVSAADQCLLIPPGAPNYEARAFYQFAEDSQIVSLFPHMHWRGKDMTYDLVLPDGTRQKILNVPHYRFDWQRVYYPTEPISAPKGSRVEMVAHFDNSAGNSANPDSKAWVRTGEQTTDEMGIGFFDFVSAKGVEPTPIKPKEYLAEVLRRHPREEGYVLNFAGGALPAGAALWLPRKEKSGILYLNPGFNLFAMDLRDLAWNGDEFACSLAVGEGIAGSGRVSSDGSVAVDFAFPEATLKDPKSAFAVRLMSHLTGNHPGAN